MFMMSFRFHRGKVLIGLLAVVVVAAGFVGFGKLAERNTIDVAAETGMQEVKEGSARKIVAKTNEQRIAFAKSFGWEVTEEPAEIQEVIIPKEFDEVYTAYNSMQKTQGFDLAKFAGKRCKRYSYVITNYPQADGEVRLNILVYGDKVIGGDVSSQIAGGFMHGFAMAT